MRKSVSSLAIAAAMVFAGGNIAHAEPATDDREATADTETCEQTDGQQAGEVAMTSVADDDAQALESQTIDDLESGVHDIRSADSLNANKVVVNGAEADGEPFTAVTVPVGGDYSMISNVTVVYDEQHEVVQYAETLLSENADGNFHIETYVDGTQTTSEDTDVRFMSDAELLTESEEAADDREAQPAGVGSTVACLAAVGGIGGTAAYFIAGACAGACVSGVGAGVCAACIGGYAALGAGGMTAAASCFN